LTIENNTAFGNLYKRGILKPLNEGHAADMYEETQIIMNNYNMPAYEISNHALPGHESVHNMRYWQYKDFIGIGPGAHGRIISNDQDKSCLDTSQRINNMKKNAIATVDERLPHKWAERVKGKGHGLDSISVLDEKMLQEEKILMGMRVKHGLPISILPQSAHKQIPKLLDLNLIKIHNDRIRATTKGMMLLNQVIFLLLDE
jgi:oxygen-independent coproporphyrinogen-3 oxidase